MKKILLLVSLLIVSFSIMGCGSSDNMILSSSSSINYQNTTKAGDIKNNITSEIKESTESKSLSNSNEEIDIDLTQLSSSMVYAQVYDMVNNGNDYLGKTVKAKGPFAYYKDEQNGNEYFAVIISDATACCAQGIEFVLDGEYTYPDDYPELETEITVTGIFNYYKEDYNTYCQLLNAQLYTESELP